MNAPIFEYLLRLGDDRLVLGHRLSEWCGHAPMLEEDIALTNIALDYVGQASALLKLAGEVEDKGRSEDDLAYFREAIDFQNCQLVEQPRGDFAITMARQFLFDTYSHLLYGALAKSSFQPLADIAAKASKEIAYHLRHSSEWILRLGDGTEESHQRMQSAFDQLWTYTAELFATDEVDEQLIAEKVVPNLTAIKPKWKKMVSEQLEEATLRMPSDECYMVSGSRHGRHSEHLGYLLGEMQILQRSYPECAW